ncbi:MAG: HAMP domain-containing sensor histidine kinase [Planctomycetota bacterium]
MYKRLIILSVIILAALCGLVWMGYHSIRIRAQGMAGARLGEFAAVAEQIRLDVKRKLDDFLRTEQNRPYTDYQSYYVPDYIAPPGARPGQQQMPVLRSPLVGKLENGLAYGNFQIEPDRSIITPNDNFEQEQNVADSEDRLSLGPLTGNAEVLSNRKNIEDNVLPALDRMMPLGRDKDKLPQSQRAQSYPVESLQSQSQQTQVIEQERSVLEQNKILNMAPPPQPGPGPRGVQQGPEQESYQAETVSVRIEPFVPLVVPGAWPQGRQAGESIFGGQVFLLRGVQIEEKHFLQGFQLNENKLIDEVRESASRFMREGMSFELSPMENPNTNGAVAYTAILDFGFGDLILNLKEVDPDWIHKQIYHLRNWYVGIVAVVLLAVSFGLASLWHNTRAQIALGQRKDDFLSAVSHELRTPLTSIRMYAEMLEKNWVKSPDKAAEYYGNMRQESERLGRLIENVLDFSRIQKRRKTYAFDIGDINRCTAGVIETMKPYAELKGFSIETKFGQLEESTFDSDAVTQIVVNLLDNAIKYARNAEDKTITVRTRNEDRFVLIEVEDHGPGVPHRQRKKIFEQFYRLGAEATRETSGTGLGLALVKTIAEAHDGFVEVIGAKPTGAIFRVALATRV